MAAAIVIDSLEFARGRGRLSGGVPVVGLTRMSDVLSNSEGTLDYTVVGVCDDRERPQLDLRVTGTLYLYCQRCLEPLDHRVDIANTLVLVPPSSPAEPLENGDDVFFVSPDAPDCIEASAELNVGDLIEDEVLLSLPPYPRHAEGTCVSKAAAYEAGHAVDSKFAGLAVLRNLGKTIKE